MSVGIERAKQNFAAHFGMEPTVGVRAPGRVNIIGEHTDYNHGYVLPMAIARETVILARPRNDKTLNAFAANLHRTAKAVLDSFSRNPDESWLDYIVGVAAELSKLGKPLTGADLMIIGDVPLGCGLSSSASLEMAALTMFEALAGFCVEGPAAAQLGQRVENDFLGLSSGIMDQFISRLGKQGHALFLDCRSLDYEHIPVAFSDACFVVANTGVSRGLTKSKYNERVEQCRQAVAALTKTTGTSGSHLRDFTADELEFSRGAMPEVAYRRARHVITEDQRTLEACEAMRAGDATALGALMNASDDSLRDDYEVTCPELDAMTAIARALNTCYGSRMTGAGFGGCTVSLVRKDSAEAFADALMARYAQETGLTGEVIISEPAAGAETLAL